MSWRGMIAVAAVVAVGVVGWFAGNAVAGNDGLNASAKPARTVTVSASATVKTAPDEVAFNLGVSSRAADSAQAMSQNASAMNAVIAAVKSAGITQNDIQTLQLSLHQQVEKRQEPYRLVQRMGLQGAIVILKTPSGTGMAAEDLVRNDPLLDAPVLYARKDVEIETLRRWFPDRALWIYERPDPAAPGQLVPAQQLGSAAELRPLRLFNGAGAVTGVVSDRRDAAAPGNRVSAQTQGCSASPASRRPCGAFRTSGKHLPSARTADLPRPQCHRPEGLDRK